MIEIAGATNELARTEAEVAQAPSADSAALQRSCVAVLREKWSTLALVAMDPGASGRAVASALVELARSSRLPPVRVLHAAGVPAAQVPGLLDELAAGRAGETRSVVTVSDPRTSPASVPLLLAADAAVLLVRLGATELASIEDALALLGRDHVLGCIVVG
jgi:hypothetical protein